MEEGKLKLEGKARPSFHVLPELGARRAPHHSRGDPVTVPPLTGKDVSLKEGPSISHRAAGTRLRASWVLGS